MDTNVLRGILTVASLLAFAAVVWWAYAPRRRDALDAIGRSVLSGDESNAPSDR